eukprot:scpid28447/ scgid1560/ T-cell acute lymphocytic leukemia protein 1; Class A basic helix-loop-helix protein 17; Stem cell protein; T-cell leukemia/lymphoma protein 5
MFSMGETDLQARSPMDEMRSSNGLPQGQNAASVSNRSSPSTEESNAAHVPDSELDWFFPEGTDMDDFDESGASARALQGMSDDDVRTIIASENLRERGLTNTKSKTRISDKDMRQARRLLTNKRERWRQQLVNEASTNLRQLIPTFPPEKKLSKHDVLRFSARYIVYLQHQLNEMLEKQQIQAGEHPSVAKKNALATREHQDWQFASMYNHLPLNSVNAATMMTATTAYGRAASSLLRETRSTFTRTYAAPSSGATPSSSPSSPPPAQPPFAPGTAQQHVQARSNRTTPPHTSMAGGFPGPQGIATIPTPVLLSAGGNAGSNGSVAGTSGKAAAGNSDAEPHTGAGAVESQGFAPAAMETSWAPGKPPGVLPIGSVGSAAEFAALGGGHHAHHHHPAAVAHRGFPGSSPVFSQAMVPAGLHWS